MVDNEEKITLADIEDHDTNKYKKNINDLIENAEIEAEMEAEKNIRSKNSRIFLISMIGFVLLSFVYLRINNQSSEKVTPSAAIQTPIKSPEIKLAKQVTIDEESNSKRGSFKDRGLVNRLGQLSDSIGLADGAPTLQAQKVYEEISSKIDQQIKNIEYILQNDLEELNSIVNELEIPKIKPNN